MRRNIIISKTESRDYSRDEDRIDLALGMKLKTLRHIANKTQSEVADFLAISPQQYQKYEKGSSKCSLQTLYRLASCYKINVVELLPYTTAMRNGGPRGMFWESSEKSGADAAGLICDEATALSELLKVLLRVPSREMRQKLLTTLQGLD